MPGTRHSSTIRITQIACLKAEHSTCWIRDGDGEAVECCVIRALTKPRKVYLSVVSKSSKSLLVYCS